MEVKYRNPSEDLLKMSSPQKDLIGQKRSSVNTSIDVAEHYLVDVEKLISYHKQARRNFDEGEIKGLANSITEHGVRQPLTIIQSSTDRDKFEVVSGERRLKAAKLSGLQKVPCIIISDHQQAEEIALVENIQRKDLHPIEMGEAFLKILEGRKTLTQTSLAEKLGLSNKIISEAIQYAKFQKDIKDTLIKRDIKSRDFLRKLIKSDNPKEILYSKNETAPTLKNRTKSIFRILLIENAFHVQAEAVGKLPDDRKQELKNIFQEILKSL